MSRKFVLKTLLIACATPTGWVHVPSATAQALTTDQMLVISVADNTPASELNRSSLLRSISRPPPGEPLAELLGRPFRSEPYFPELFGEYGVERERLSERMAAIYDLMEHYVALHYTADVDLEVVAARVRGDGRFAFVEISRPRPMRSAVPSDQYFPLPPLPSPPDPDGTNYQWGLQANHLDLPPAWDLSTGWASVGVLDSGLPVQPTGPLATDYTIDHFDLRRHGVSAGTPYEWDAVAKNLSWDFRTSTFRRRLPSGNINVAAHGTHVTGVIAATANNGANPSGVAGICWDCPIQFGLIDQFQIEAARGLFWIPNWGAQVVNLSGAIYKLTDPTQPTGLPCSGPPPWQQLNPHCHSIAMLEAMDVPLVAAAGNDLQSQLDFPASDPRVVGVGGHDLHGALWDERNWLGDNCPTPFTPPIQCGSNVGPGLDFLAPARKVISTVPYGAAYFSAAPDLCNDSNFVGASDGLAYCTGTSMAAPHVSGVLALLRSANPLLSNADTLAAANSGVGLPGQPLAPTARLGLERVLGRVGGEQVTNRLTPMLALRIDRPETIGASPTRDRLYTTRPQVASGALLGWYLTHARTCNPGDCSGSGPPAAEQEVRAYSSVPVQEAGGLAGLDIPGIKNLEFKTTPRAAFWLFTTSASPWPGVAMKPLYRLSFNHHCDWRDHLYTTDPAAIDFVTTLDFCTADFGRQAYEVDGIEGYVLSACPAGFDCSGADPSAPQMLYRRYSDQDQMMALVLQSQQSFPFGTYQFDFLTDPQQPTYGPLGYVFPNIDTDGDTLPDGFERMLGLNPLSADSDCDGTPDGIEYPVASLQPMGADPLFGGACF